MTAETEDVGDATPDQKIYDQFRPLDSCHRRSILLLLTDNGMMIVVQAQGALARLRLWPATPSG
uniref:Uncharacterized protein n=1 Tax=Thermogemmatispora argillosa TaxID=2045280 RepID=A0A455T1J7_9CHLR|nr:hypothetical protein KTA_12910 [Thermogemmatispora argillosa]